MLNTIGKKGFIIIVTFLVILFFNNCNMDLQPYNSKSSKSALAEISDIQLATNGNYSMLTTQNYIRNYCTCFQWASDNVVQSGADADQASLSFSYEHIPNMYPTTNFWLESYKLIHGANLVINRIKVGESKELDQLKGENLYLRAMAHFNLVRLFGRPYIQDNGNNLGIPIIKEADPEKYPSRSTVKEVYEFVISDLLQAESLMTIPKNCNYATKEAAEALLSRVYLYKGDNKKAIIYANKVINSGYYSLAATNVFRKSPTLDPEDNPEIIFAFRRTPSQNAEKNAIGSLYYNDPKTQSTGWGEYYASLSYIHLLDKYPEDARHAFITPHIINGEMQYRGVAPQYYINKYNYQEGIVNLSSPTYQRLAEMYLNRAEANAKLGNDEEAIADVNLIRKRAGLSGSDLYSENDFKGLSSVLDVVLRERRLEFAFEGLRRDDLFRNNRPLVRTYPGLYPHNEHYMPGTNGYEYYFVIESTDSRVVYYIPERAIEVNHNLTQNP